LNYIVDTNVLSQTAPGRNRREVATWLVRNEQRLSLSVVTIAELRYGVEWLRHRGAERKAAELEAWLEEMTLLHASRLHPVDLAVAQETGHLLALVRARGGDVGFEDAVIAATARLKGLGVLTRNQRHFRLLDVALVDPFESLPD